MTDGRVDEDGLGGGVDPRSVERPTAGEAASAIEVALDRGRVVSLVGECGVDGPGRDERPPGDRHALLKPDGSLVVHGRDGTAADVVVAGTGGLDVAAIDGSLVIAAAGDGAGGRLRFDRVDLLASAGIDGSRGTHEAGDPADTADETERTDGRHGALRQRLLADPERIEPGFRPLSTERGTSAGPVDLFGRDAEGRAVVVEIKTHRAGPAAVGQLDRYVSALRHDLHADAEVRGVLVAPSATDRARRLLDERGFSFRALSPVE